MLQKPRRLHLRLTDVYRLVTSQLLIVTVISSSSIEKKSLLNIMVPKVWLIFKFKAWYSTFMLIGTSRTNGFGKHSCQSSTNRGCWCYWCTFKRRCYGTTKVGSLERGRHCAYADPHIWCCRAYVVPKDTRLLNDASFPSEVQEWIKGKVSHHKYLRGGTSFLQQNCSQQCLTDENVGVVAAIETIPRSPSGKILRRELRKRSKTESSTHSSKSKL